MKHYTKQSVTKGEWLPVVGVIVDGTDYEIAQQYFDDDYQDHYALYINGKRQRKTYFGETAHHDVARAYNDLVGWQNTIFGDEL